MLADRILFGLLCFLLLASLILLLFLVKLWIVYKNSLKSTNLIYIWIQIQFDTNPEFDWTKNWYDYFEKDFNYCIDHPFIWTIKQMWRDPAEYDKVVKYVKEHINDEYNFLDID